MEFHVRKALIEDSAAILNLINELAVFEKKPKSVILTISDIEKHGFSSNPLFECLVAEVKEMIVGMALYYPRFSTWKGPTFHLEDLIVSESFKGNGIGTELYLTFIKNSYESGVERIEWNVLEWNTSAINFYKKSGAKVLTDWQTVQMHRSEMKTYLQKFK